MTSNSYTVSLYLLSLFLLFNFSSPLIFWILTEFNLILFVSFINLGGFKFQQEMNDTSLYYFIIQSLSSMLFLGDFYFSLDLSMFHHDLFFVSAMLLKLGIFPLFFWVFKIRDFFSLNCFTVLMSLQKIPFFMVLYSSLNYISLNILIFSFLCGSLMIFFCKDLKSMVICSSISYGFWVVYIYFYNTSLFLLFMLIYGLYLLNLMIFYHFTKGSFGLVLALPSFMFFLGLSPLSLFFFKVIGVTFLVTHLGAYELLAFWFFSMLLLFGYMKFCFKSLSMISSLYDYVKFWKKKMFYSCFVPLFFLLFLV